MTMRTSRPSSPQAVLTASNQRTMCVLISACQTLLHSILYDDQDRGGEEGVGSGIRLCGYLYKVLCSPLRRQLSRLVVL